MRALVRFSQTNSPYTFILLPGIYTSSELKGHNNQTIAALDKHFDDPTIISFAGYLSPQFLKGTCNKIPWDILSLSKDLYSRLRTYLIKIKANPQYTGIIGASGGAGLIPLMLANDAQNSSEDPDIDDRSSIPKDLFFGLGGIAFSPTLHGRTVYHNLDNSYQISSSHTLQTLTQRTWANTWLFLKTGGKISWTDVADLYALDPINFLHKASNEFTLVSLNNILKAIGVNKDQLNGPFSYYDVYINTGFRNDKSISSNSNIDALYDKATDIRPFLDQITQPFLIYFSQDDPIASSYNNSGQPEVITDILYHAQNNPNIIVFNPKYGAHTGCFLDPIFDELIGTFFQ